jgi:hypothetical protein
VGHSAQVAPPLPWGSREAVLQRDSEIRRIWEERRGAHAPQTSADWESDAKPASKR